MPPSSCSMGRRNIATRALLLLAIFAGNSDCRCRLHRLNGQTERDNYSVIDSEHHRTAAWLLIGVVLPPSQVSYYFSLPQQHACPKLVPCTIAHSILGVGWRREVQRYIGLVLFESTSFDSRTAESFKSAPKAYIKRRVVTPSHCVPQCCVHTPGLCVNGFPLRSVKYRLA